MEESVVIALLRVVLRFGMRSSRLLLSEVKGGNVETIVQFATLWRWWC